MGQIRRGVGDTVDILVLYKRRQQKILFFLKLTTDFCSTSAVSGHKNLVGGRYRSVISAGSRVRQVRQQKISFFLKLTTDFCSTSAASGHENLVGGRYRSVISAGFRVRQVSVKRRLD